MPLIAFIFFLVIFAPPFIFYLLQTKYSTPNHNLPNLYKFQKEFIAIHVVLSVLFFAFHLLELNNISFRGILFEKIILWLYFLHLIISPIFVNASTIKIKFFQNYFKLFVFTPLLFLSLLSLIFGSLLILIVPYFTLKVMISSPNITYKNSDVRIEDTQMSFAGGEYQNIYIKGNILEYKYDLPHMKEDSIYKIKDIQVIDYRHPKLKLTYKDTSIIISLEED